MTTSDAFISVIVPVRDCAPILSGFVEELTEVLRTHFKNWEVVFIDDGSTDDTAARLRVHVEADPGLRLVRLSRSFGDQVAISAGLDLVIGDFVVILFPNQHPPGLMVEMVQQAQASTGIVFACRRTRSSDSRFVQLGAGAFRWYCRRVLSLALPKRATSYCVLSRRVVNAITRDRGRLRDLRLLGLVTGFATTTVSFDEIDRGLGVHRRRFGEQLNLALAIMVRSSRHPLRWAGAFCLLAALGNLCWALWLLASHLFYGPVPQLGLMLAVASSACCGLGAIAVIGEYIGQQQERGEDRPMYYVMDDIHRPAGSDSELNVVAESMSVPAVGLSRRGGASR